MSSENIFISEQTIEKIKEECGSIKDSDIRCKAAANRFASNIAKMFFEDNELDCESGIHNIPEVISDIEISDVYIKNCFIDVRMYFNSNELCVPADLFKRNLLPVAFMFIKVSEDLSGAEITGYITPSEVIKSKEINGYYPVNETSLLSFYDIEPLLNADDIYEVNSDDTIEVFDYLDDKLDDIDGFYRKLFESKPLRLEFIKAASAKKKFVNIINSFKNILSEDSEENETSNLDENILSETEDDLSDITPLESVENISDLELQDDENEFEELTEEAGELEEFDTDSTLDEIGIDNNVELEQFSSGSDDLSQNEGQDFDSDNIEEEGSLLDYDDDKNAQSYEIQDYNNFENNDETDSLYSTETTPSLKMYEDDENSAEPETQEIEEVDSSAEDTEQESVENIDSEIVTEETESYNVKEENVEEDSEINEPEPESDEVSDEIAGEDADDIDALFSNDDIESSDAGENESFDNYEEIPSDIDEADVPQKPKKPILPLIGALIIIAGVAYMGFTKISHSNAPQQNTQNIVDVDTDALADNDENTAQEEQPEAMPTETVENVAKDKTKNEGTAVSIPAIENNLDASVLVSNLSISWEVPAEYTTNNSAKRYFAKIGKIIQMNLKAELLLLSKPPINNKIVLELEYNKDSGNYSIKNLSVSSGEKTIDSVVTNTVKNVLNMNLNINTSSFGNIQGNPMLIIKL